MSELPQKPAQAQNALRVVTTVAPLANIALNVGGTHIALTQIVPDGTDSHTFEPTPSDARALAEADLIIVNGLHLEGNTLAMAQSNKRPRRKFWNSETTRSLRISGFRFQLPG